ncbi:MAG TPA: hypothetical protein VN969_42800 [Streptosporangiaceae bacterium]|nr:hypothetical protein [Streptosporangiaceae bacterium]
MASSCGGGLEGFICHIIPFIPIVGGEIGVGGKAVQDGVSAAGADVLTQIAQAMSSAANGLLKTLSSFWMGVDTPDLTSSGAPAVGIEADLRWVTTCTAVVCILVAAGRMTIRRRGEPAAVMALGLARLVVVSAAATFLVQTAGMLGDTFSSDLMSAAHVGSGGWAGLISTAALAGAFAGGDGMLLIISLLVIFSSLIQLMLMILRVGLLVILTGTLPLAAAASMSDWGQTWWRKHLAWLTAWLLYKPAAALLYAGAFLLTDDGKAVEVISGFMLLILSVLILPALLKLIVPMTASLGAASSGTLAMGAAGAVATGAVKAAAMIGTGGAASAGAVAGAVGATGAGSAANAPSGSSAPAGAAPGQAGTEAAAPSRSSPDSSERAVVPPPGTGKPAQGAGGSNAGTAADGVKPGGTGKVADGGGSPAPSGSPPQGPPQAQTAKDSTDATGVPWPSGAGDDGDDGDQETGG